MSKPVSLSDLELHVTMLLEAVKSGETIEISDRGRPVARLLPYSRDDSVLREYEDLIISGQIRPRKRPLPDDFWDRPRNVDPEGRLLRALLDERDENR
jgi:prevent-host-death family protein